MQHSGLYTEELFDFLLKVGGIAYELKQKMFSDDKYCFRNVYDGRSVYRLWQ